MKRIDSVNARQNANGVGKTGFHDNADLSGQAIIDTINSYLTSAWEPVYRCIEDDQNTIENTLKDLVNYLKLYLSEFDEKINDVAVIHGPNRVGDIPHSLASIEKAKQLLGYHPKYSFQDGLKEAVKWYWENLK